ncbi:hypothetical protein O988_03379 [Pseudogymnoascus sp. VKM F-3808]|nr:hypothetical protein O988_03379 [Pseudogymnoascus sp. VKM F-3808]
MHKSYVGSVVCYIHRSKASSGITTNRLLSIIDGVRRYTANLYAEYMDQLNYYTILRADVLFALDRWAYPYP